MMHLESMPMMRPLKVETYQDLQTKNNDLLEALTAILETERRNNGSLITGAMEDSFEAAKQVLDKYK